MNRIIPDHLSGDVATTEIAERMDQLRGGAPRPGEAVRGTGGGGTSIPPLSPMEVSVGSGGVGSPRNIRDTAAVSRANDVASMLLAGPVGAALRRPLPADQIPAEVAAAFALVLPGHDAIRPARIGLFGGQIEGWQTTFHGTGVNVDVSTTDLRWRVSTPCIRDDIRGNDLLALLREARAQTAAVMAEDAAEKAREAREIAEYAALWGSGPDTIKSNPTETP